MIAHYGRLRARTRLTLWYVLLLAGTLVGLGGLGYWAVERTLYANADDVLRAKAGAVQSVVEQERGRMYLESHGSTDPQAPLVTTGLDAVRVWDRDGRTIYQWQGLPDLPPVDPATLTATLSGQSGYLTTRTGGGTNVRLHARPILDRDRVLGAIQVGRSEAETEAVLARLRLLGASGLVVGLALAGVIGYFLAGRALAPVDRITRAAEQIGADDLSRRLALALPDDELGRLATAFDGMIDRLDGAFQRQRRFTADASHELRTPLTIIRSQAEVALARPREPAYYARVLSSIREEAERLGHLVESLLIMARADAGRALTLEPVDLEEIVAEAGARVATRAHERGIRLAVEIESTHPVRGDATWLTQLLSNLLDNALRHTPSGGQVTLSVGPAPDGALLKVADTGEGIAPEHLPHLFERFYRADQARSRSAGGTGLGLAICDWVARMHGGRLEVDSTLGRGTTFSLWLPLAAAPAPAPSPGPAPVGRPAAPAEPAYHSVS